MSSLLIAMLNDRYTKIVSLSVPYWRLGVADYIITVEASFDLKAWQKSQANCEQIVRTKRPKISKTTDSTIEKTLNSLVAEVAKLTDKLEAVEKARE